MKPTLQTLFAQIRVHIARDEMPAALRLLRSLLENTPRLNEILQQSGRLQNIRQQIRTGTISHDDATLEQNRIRFGVLGLLAELEKDSLPTAAWSDLLAAVEQESTRPEVREEVENAVAIVNSKNVVSDSTLTAGGDVHIGDKHYHASSPKTPQQLTTAAAAVPSGFIGREKELSEIRQRLHSSNSALALVNAEGGMGKTTLAAAYWQRFSAEYKHRAWLFCENGILNAMRSLLPEALDLREVMNEVADQPERQIQLIITRMANLPKDCLLKLGAHSFEIKTHWSQNLQTEAANSDQVIQALYNTGSLAPEESELLAQFCLLPAENHPPAVLGTLLAPGDKLGLKRHLDQLAQKGWLSSAANSYRVSPVVQKILLDKYAEQRWALGAAMVERLSVVFEHEGTHSKNINMAEPFAELVFGLVDNLGVANEELAKLYAGLWYYHNASGNLAKALNTAERMRALCETSEDQFNLGPAYAFLGSTHRALGNLSQALASFEKYNDLEKELHEAFPHDVNFKNGLAVSYQHLGMTHRDLGNLQQALTFYEQYNDLEKELHQAYPQNVYFKNLLAISYAKLGDTYRTLGNVQQALSFYEQYNVLEQELYGSYPQNVGFKNGLASSYSKLGETHSDLGNLNQALTFFEQLIELMKELYSVFPQNVEFKNGLAVAYSQLGSFYQDKMNAPEKARPYFQQCFDIWKDLIKKYPDYQEFKKNYNWAKAQLGD